MTRLNHILSLGIDAESYYSEISLKHINNANSIKSDIVKWHKDKHDLYEIDLNNKQVSKKNVQGLISKVTSLIDDKYKYNKLDDRFNPYEKDVEVVYIENEYYYIPTT